jgi:xanthine dehydrogenase accessory factor
MSLLARARQLVDASKKVALVRVKETRGSVPRETGAMMLVTEDGMLGSVGGGTLEWKAMASAQRLLRSGGQRTFERYVLGPDLGQCCGGQVSLETVVLDPQALDALETAEEPRNRPLYIFGAGHVGRALVLLLAQFDFEIHWCDPRPGAFPAVTPANVVCRNDDDMPGILGTARQGSLVLVMTHSHTLDLAVVDASLRQQAVVATGLIGSATKRARFEKRLAAAGIPPERVAELICPIGIGGIRSKRPEAIALSTAAQLVALDETLKVREASPSMILHTGGAAS